MLGEVEADIFGRLIGPSSPTLTPTTVKGILSLGYPEADRARMVELAARSNQGTLTMAERRELEAYVFVGDALSALKSNARLFLNEISPRLGE